MLHIQKHDDILELVLDNPPVNALGRTMRAALYAAIEKAGADDSVKAIVIDGGAKLFSAGADIAEFGDTMSREQAGGLPQLVDLIEACAKPVVAAIRGTCFGGALEVALACHYRVAAPSAKLGVPEVKLGLLPGAGGTQRLPRLVGVQAALEMIVSGDPVSAQKAEALGLVDKITGEETLVPEAIAYARTVPGVRRTGERKATAEPGVFEKFAADNARKLKGMDAPAACIAAVKDAVDLPLAEGLANEREHFFTLMQGDQSKGLRHIFFAERTAAKIAGLPKETRLRTISKIGVIGAGTMGGGISMNFLSAGVPVTIVETNKEALDRGVTTVRNNYEASAAKGRFTGAQVEKAMALLTPSLDFNALADCDLVIEAVYENMDVKLEIFKKLSGLVKPGAMLASNTSYLNIDEMAAVTDRPQDVLGTHFFSPANVMKLVEVVRGGATAPDALATAMDLARRIKKVPVVSRVCFGFIGNRMLEPRQRQSVQLLLDGATPEQIDRVHLAFGMPMGPFQMADLAGVDIGWHRDPTRVTTVYEALAAQGRWGQKTKAGFYDYDENRKPQPSPVTAQIVDDFRKQTGRTTRPVSDEEILVRTLYTMINEGAKILEEGIAQRASDIDVVWVFGYGWPAVKGGPMFYADTVGLQTIVDGLEKYKDVLGTVNAVAPLLRERAAAGKGFEG